MSAATSGRPLRFFGLVMLGWVAIRLVGQQVPPPIPTLTPMAQAQRAPPQHASRTSVALAPTSAGHVPARAALARWPLHTEKARPHPAPTIRRAIIGDDAMPVDMMNFINVSIGFANRHYASDPDYRDGFAATATPTPFTAARAPNDRWHGSGWLLWRDGGASPGEAIPVSRLGGSQAGLRIDYDLMSQASSVQASAYGRVTSALASPAAPEAAIGLSIQPVRSIPVRIAAERRIALGKGGRNANSVMAVGGFGPAPIGPALMAEGYAQTGLVGFRRQDAFVDGKLSLLAPLSQSPIRIGAALSGGAQPGASRLDIGPELQVRLPLPQLSARIAVEWRERVAGDARPGSGLAMTLAADF